MALRKKNEAEIKLGDKYRDKITGFVGVAIGRHEYIHGCTRITLQAARDGDLKEYSFDAPALVAVSDEQEFSSRKTGGPRSAPSPRPTR